MEKNKNIKDRQLEIIHHIKNIAQDLYSQQEKSLEQQVQKKSPSKQFVRTKKHQQEEYPVNNRYSFTQANSQSYSKLHNQQSKKKKRLIFSNFQQLLEKANKSQQRKETTPIIDRINQGIYNQFKTQGKAKIDLSQSVLNCEERQALWDDFLTRGQRWQKQKKKSKREKQLQGVFKNIAQRNHIKTATNLIAGELKMQRQMTQVEKSIRKIRLQTQKLRQKVLEINNGEGSLSKFNMKRTYK